MDKISTEVEINKTEKPKTTRGKISEQKEGLRIQDRIDLTKVKSTSFGNSVCASAYYRHRFVFPIGMTSAEIHKFNGKCKENDRLEF